MMKSASMILINNICKFASLSVEYVSENICIMVDLFDKAAAEGAR